MSADSNGSTIGLKIIDFIRQTPTKFCRDFGLLLAVFCTVLGCWKPKVGLHLRVEFLTAGLVFAALSLTVPTIFRPVAAVWRLLSIGLHLIFSPIVLGVLYYFVLTPIGILLRICKWDPLRLAQTANESSFWIRREPAGPTAESYRKQF